MVFLNINKIILLVMFSSLSFGQTIRQEKMNNLKFLVGDWVGISTSYENEKVKRQVSASEKIKYSLDGHIITIDLHSETLQLHTVIYYDEKEDTYYYNPFYKNGAAKYKAEFLDNKLIVKPSETRRFVFTLDKSGNFNEYGENLVNGKWIKYFEDIFEKKN